MSFDSDLSILDQIKNGSNDAWRKTLILYGVVACLWLVHYEKDETFYHLPKQYFWKFFIYVDYTRAFFFLLLVPAYGFFNPLKQPVHQWFFGILFLALMEYQLKAIASFGQLYHSTCTPAFWRYTGTYGWYPMLSTVRQWKATLSHWFFHFVLSFSHYYWECYGTALELLVAHGGSRIGH